MDAKKIGEQISKLRKERNMCQVQLANKLYVTEKAVSKWECGNGIPDLDNIGRLAEIFDISIDELLMAEEKDKAKDKPDAVSEEQNVRCRRGVVSEEQKIQLQKGITEEQMMQLQKSNSPLINSYEDIVVYSSHLSDTLINRFAEEYMDTITQFEEIFYLLDHFTQETLQKLCLYHKDKIMEDIDLTLLLGRIDSDCFSALCDCKCD